MVDGPKGKPTQERRREYRQAHAVGQALAGMSEVIRERTVRNAKRHMRHSGPFRDGYNVLRHPNGRFAPETAPKHKRPKRVPFTQKEKEKP